MFSTLRIWLENAKKHISAILIVIFLIAIIFLGVGIVGGIGSTGTGQDLAHTLIKMFSNEKRRCGIGCNSS